MKIIQLTLLVCIYCSLDLFGQSANLNFGARSKGLGNANSTLTGEWSVFNNVAGISGLENGTVFFGYDIFSGLEGFDQIAAGVIQPFKFGTTGLSVYRFGDELYNESLISASFGNKIGFVRLGLKANYYQIRIDEIGTAGTVSFDFGGMVELVPEFSFGAYISNFTLSTLNNSRASDLPVTMKIGFAYKPVPELNLVLDLHKDINYDAVIKAGLEYAIHQKFYLRTGINSNPFNGFFGAGIRLDRFQIDYAVGANQYLGTSHQASVSFTYQKRDEH